MTTTATDDHVVQQVLNGDTEAFATVVERYQQIMYRFALTLLRSPHDAQDAVNESWIKAYSALGSYRLGTSFKSWIMTITYHTAHDMLRYRTRHPLADDDVITTTADAKPGPQAQLLSKERQATLFEAMMRLSSDDRTVLYLYYYVEASYQDIAGILNCRPGTVASRLSRAKNRLKQQMEAGETP